MRTALPVELRPVAAAHRRFTEALHDMLDPAWGRCTGYVRRFLVWADREPAGVTHAHIGGFLLHLKEQGRSAATLSLHLEPGRHTYMARVRVRRGKQDRAGRAPCAADSVHWRP